MKYSAILGIGLFAALCLPQVRTGLESSMIGQMVIQIPLLALAGYLFGNGIRKNRAMNGSRGIPGLVMIIFTSIFWLLPRSLDGALNSTFFEIGKYISIPLLIGFPLAFNWRKLPEPVKGFVWANMISMLFVMGWLYANAPIRLCNNYLKGQQISLGKTLMVLALMFLLSFFCKAFFFGNKSGDKRIDTFQ